MIKEGGIACLIGPVHPTFWLSRCAKQHFFKINMIVYDCYYLNNNNKRPLTPAPPSLLCLSLFVCRGRRYALQE